MVTKPFSNLFGEFFSPLSDTEPVEAILTSLGVCEALAQLCELGLAGEC